MYRPIAAVALFLFIATALVAQLPRVDVRLQQPPPNQLRVADLWKIELNNRSNETILVFLRGTANENSIPDGQIAEAFSSVFELPPGIMRVTARQIQPIDVPNYNERYYEALLTTGNVPTGEYEICVEVIEEATQAMLGRDCKFVTVNRMSVPILVSPFDESEVADKYGVFTWMSAVPPARGQDLRYQLSIVEIFGRQTPQDAMSRNPRWFEVRDLKRTIFQYPISARSFEVGRSYAWMIQAYEIRGTVVVPLGESEVWQFTYRPLSGAQDERPAGGFKAVVVNDSVCNGDNWDFEPGNLACWEVAGEAFVDDPILDAHEVLGQNGHHLKYWVSSHGAYDADKAQGTMLSQMFQIQHSAVGFLFGGGASEQAGVMLLVEKLDTDTFSLETMNVPGTSKAYYVAYTTAKTDEASSSERLVPIEWNVLRYLNRSAYFYVRDSSISAHINFDNVTFYNIEDKDKIKLPVKVMAAGENHSLAATPKETPPPDLNKLLADDLKGIKGGNGAIKDINIVNNTSPHFKASMKSAMSSKSGNNGGDDNNFDLNLKGTKVSPQISKMQGISGLVSKVKQDNVVWGWGDNIDKAVGPQLPSVVKEPKNVATVKNVQSLAAGPWHSLAVQNDGTVWGWGDNDHAQVGSDNRATQSTPTKLKTIKDATVVSTGAFVSMAADEKGNGWIWGWNRFNGLGFDLDQYPNPTTGQVDSTVYLYSPFPLLGTTGVVDVAVGEAHAVLLKANGLVSSWGVNNRGQTGQPMSDPRTESARLVQMGNNSDMLNAKIEQIEAGFDHTLALGSDGRVWAWGGNASGQLGDGTAKDRSTPKAVPNLGGIVAIAAGDGYSLAVDTTGTLWAWGNNVLGQLGDGTRVGKWEPVKVARIDAVQGVVAGGAHAMAVRADGGLWTWGTNDVGQMGEGPITNLVPVPLNPALGPLRVERLANKKP